MTNESYWKKVVRDRWIWLWFIFLIILVFLVERQFDERSVVTEVGVFQDAVCFKWSRYDRKWKMRLLVNGDVVSLMIPQENCEFFMSLRRDIDEIEVRYSSVGNGNELLNAWYKGKSIYDADFESERNAYSLSRVPFYSLPIILVLWRMINIFIEKKRLSDPS